MIIGDDDGYGISDNNNDTRDRSAGAQEPAARLLFFIFPSQDQDPKSEMGTSPFLF